MKIKLILNEVRADQNAIELARAENSLDPDRTGETLARDELKRFAKKHSRVDLRQIQPLLDDLMEYPVSFNNVDPTVVIDHILGYFLEEDEENEKNLKEISQILPYILNFIIKKDNLSDYNKARYAFKFVMRTNDKDFGNSDKVINIYRKYSVKDYYFSYMFAKYIDKKYSEETLKGVLFAGDETLFGATPRSNIIKKYYQLFRNQIPPNDIKTIKTILNID